MDFETQVGDLASILKVDSRRMEALERKYSDSRTLMLIDRYRFLDLLPCTNDQLRVIGYQVGGGLKFALWVALGILSNAILLLLF